MSDNFVFFVDPLERTHGTFGDPWQELHRSSSRPAPTPSFEPDVERSSASSVRPVRRVGGPIRSRRYSRTPYDGFVSHSRYDTVEANVLKVNDNEEGETVFHGEKSNTAIFVDFFIL